MYDDTYRQPNLFRSGGEGEEEHINSEWIGFYDPATRLYDYPSSSTDGLNFFLVGTYYFLANYEVIIERG